jgi:hypothetical protein
MCGCHIETTYAVKLLLQPTASIDVNQYGYQFIDDWMPILGAHTSEVDEEKGIILYVWSQ